MPLIDYVNELIDFSMSFPFYQRLNPLFNWGDPRARAKMLRPIDKGADIQLNNGFNH